ncbi:MAG: hypothetical protein U0X92_08210 [Anaerolineales bacterium]
MISQHMRYFKFIKLLVVTLAVCIMISNCIPPTTPDVSNNLSPTANFSTAVSLPPTDLSATVPPASCVENQINLNNILDTPNINDYRISEDNQSIYLQSEDKWMEYSVANQDLKGVADPSKLIESTPGVLEQRYFSIAGQDDELAKYRMSVSPNGNKLIYWVVSKHPLLRSTPTGPPLDQANESFGVHSEIDMFMIETDKEDIAYLGRILGGVKRVHWVQDGKRALVEMISFSPNYLWLIDLPSQTVTPLLSSSDVLDAPQFALLDISSDGNWAMFQTSLIDHNNLLDINQKRIRPIYALPRVVGAWWLPNNQSIIAILNAGPGYYSIYKYELNTDEISRLMSDIKSGGVFSFLYSTGDKAYLVNINKDYASGFYEIHVINLCVAG